MIAINLAESAASGLVSSIRVHAGALAYAVNTSGEVDVGRVFLRCNNVVRQLGPDLKRIDDLQLTERVVYVRHKRELIRISRESGTSERVRRVPPTAMTVTQAGELIHVSGTQMYALPDTGDKRALIALPGPGRPRTVKDDHPIHGRIETQVSDLRGHTARADMVAGLVSLGSVVFYTTLGDNTAPSRVYRLADGHPSVLLEGTLAGLGDLTRVFRCLAIADGRLVVHAAQARRHDGHQLQATLELADMVTGEVTTTIPIGDGFVSSVKAWKSQVIVAHSVDYNGPQTLRAFDLRTGEHRVLATRPSRGPLATCSAGVVYGEGARAMLVPWT